MAKGARVQRDDLIGTAAELFGAKGYAGATVRDIADRLGVTSAALYHHVDHKEDLLYEIVDHAMSLAERHLAEALEAEVGLEEKLRRIIRHHVLAVLDESQLMMTVFFQEIGLLRGKGWAGIETRRRRYQERIVEVFRQAEEQGLIRTPDVRVTVYGVLGMCNWLHRWYRRDGALTPDEVGAHFAEMVLRGLLVPRTKGG